MSRNIEIKASVGDLAPIEARVRAIATHGPEDLVQDDTFFTCANGRLKLRELAEGRGELIHYLRGDEAGPKVSDYSIARTSAPAELRETLARAFGVLGRVAKKRRLYLVDRTRIHLDQVEGLGTFVELEVVLNDAESPQEGEGVARELMDRLGIHEDRLVTGAYIDLLWRRDVFERYARERRTARIPNFTLDALGDLTRHLPKGSDDEALLSFARFSPEAADDRIHAELGHLGARGWAAEWKVHDFDEPPDLRRRLLARGLTVHHIEALMVLDVAAAPLRNPAAKGVVIEEASGTAVEEMALLQEEVWQCRLPWLAGVLHEMTDPAQGTGVAYCARASGRVVGSGWIDFHGGSGFAQLCGGAVLEGYRGRGVYTQLFERRLAEAKRRGVPFIAVDAAPMSRPILEARGFEYVCNTYPMRTRPHDTGAVTRG